MMGLLFERESQLSIRIEISLTSILFLWARVGNCVDVGCWLKGEGGGRGEGKDKSEAVPTYDEQQAQAVSAIVNTALHLPSTYTPPAMNTNA